MVFNFFFLFFLFIYLFYFILLYFLLYLLSRIMTILSPSSAAPPLAPPTRIEQLQMPRNCALADLICVFPPFISTSEILCTQTLFEYLFYYYFILV